MRLLTLATVAVISLFSFAHGTPTSRSKWFDEQQTYKHFLHLSYKSCMDNQNGDFFENCVQMLELYPDGTASLMLTDIMNDATYEILSDRIIVKTQGPGDAPAELNFLTDVTLRNLILQGTTSVWELEQFSEDK